MWLGGGSHEMLMLELLLGFTTVTVTALGGALGTEGTQADRKVKIRILQAAGNERNEAQAQVKKNENML